MANMRLDAMIFDGVTQVRALIDHPMESGARTDRENTVIKAEFIKHVSVRRDEEKLLDTDWGPTVSKNPYLAFEFEGATVGDKLTVEWVDSRGNSGEKIVVVEEGST